jgi:hypothetical protein
LELYVTHLEQYNTILHEEVHRLHDLMNPNHQPQAVEDDVGAVVVPGGEDNEEEDPEEDEPMLESREEASHVTAHHTSPMPALPLTALDSLARPSQRRAPLSSHGPLEREQGAPARTTASARGRQR